MKKETETEKRFMRRVKVFKKEKKKRGPPRQPKNSREVILNVGHTVYLKPLERLALHKYVLENNYKEPMKAAICEVFDITLNYDDRVQAGLLYDVVSIRCADLFKNRMCNKIFTDLILSMGIVRVDVSGVRYYRNIRMKPLLRKQYEKKAKKITDDIQSKRKKDREAVRAMLNGASK